MSEYRAYNGSDLPGARRAPCLGCGERVVLRRDAHLRVAGLRDGSWLLFIDTAPHRSQATDPGRIFAVPDAELLGVAHRACRDLARRRLEAGEVDLPEKLPRLIIDQEVGDLPPLHLPPTSGMCPFCGRTDLTDDHIWPEWFSRALADKGGFVMPTPYGPRAKPQVEITVPTCYSCNNGWLSILDNDVAAVLRPMVRGDERTRTLSPDEQRLLSTWSVKTAFLLDLYTGTPVIPTGFFYDLRQRRSALPGNAVWLGAYSGSQYAAWASHDGLHVGTTADRPATAFLTTFTAFRVVFQVFGHFTKGNASINDRRSLSAALARIWPPTDESVDWPRQRLAFNDSSLLTLASSFSAGG
jgi:hypothetical protein